MCEFERFIVLLRIYPTGSGTGLYEDERDYYNGDGPVMMIYGIDQDNFNCDKLFNLLCLYGNCNKVLVVLEKELLQILSLLSNLNHF